MSTPTIDHDLDLDRRVGRLEGLAEHFPARLDGLERRMEAGFAELRQAIAAANEATNSRMDKQFRWLIGIQFGIIGLLVTILLKGG